MVDDGRDETDKNEKKLLKFYWIIYYDAQETAMCLKENLLEGLYILTNLSAGRRSLGLGYDTSCFYH